MPLPTLTVDEAVVEVTTNPGKYTTYQSLLDLAARFPVDPPGVALPPGSPPPLTLAYSGGSGVGGLSMQPIAYEIGANFHLNPMNFINDLVTEEDRKRFDFSVFKRPPSFISPIRTPRTWTVDRAAGVFLIWIGNQGHDASNEDRKKGVEYYSLWWNGINIECKLWRVTHAENSVTWKQDWIDVPEANLDKKEEIIEVLKHALQVYQVNGESGHLTMKYPKYPAYAEIKFDL